MDEETTLYTEEGGIDFKNLDAFDKWLCEPKHLQQILPETKGIIALRLRVATNSTPTRTSGRK